MRGTRFLGFFLLVISSNAFSAPVFLNGTALKPPLETRGEPGAEHLRGSDLPQLGITVITEPGHLRLARANWRLQFVAGAWKPATSLPAPTEITNAKTSEWLIPVRALEQLGFKITRRESEFENSLFLASVKNQNIVNVQKLEIERGPTSKLKIFLNGKPEISTNIAPGLLSLRMQNTSTKIMFAGLGTEAISRYRLIQDGSDALLEAETGLRAATSVQLANSSDESTILLELVSSLPETKPSTNSFEEIAANPPQGLELEEKNLGTSKLWLVRMDANKFMPRVVAAPWGGTRSVAEFATRTNAVVAVNGGYFDPSTSQAVDLLLSEGQIFSYARGNRTTVAVLENNLLFGTPKTRLNLQLKNKQGLQNIPVSAIRPNPHSQWVTAFMGDGFVPVGASGWVSWVISHGNILETREDQFVPLRDQWVISFKRDAFPKLLAKIGDSADINLTWSDATWSNATDILAAGPKLITNSQYAIDASSEGFDTQNDLWRAARQVALGWQNNNYVVAMLERGTPEEFANALVEAGLSEAMRLDSGTSAQVCVNGKMLDNRVGRVVPNAVVFVAK